MAIWIFRKLPELELTFSKLPELELKLFKVATIAIEGFQITGIAIGIAPSELDPTLNYWMEVTIWFPIHKHINKYMLFSTYSMLVAIVTLTVMSHMETPDNAPQIGLHPGSLLAHRQRV